jgi:hypothetical protein
MPICIRVALGPDFSGAWPPAALPVGVKLSGGVLVDVLRLTGCASTGTGRDATGVPRALGGVLVAVAPGFGFGVGLASTSTGIHRGSVESAEPALEGADEDCAAETGRGVATAGGAGLGVGLAPGPLTTIGAGASWAAATVGVALTGSGVGVAN